jgi:hypothetical protein
MDYFVFLEYIISIYSKYELNFEKLLQKSDPSPTSVQYYPYRWMCFIFNKLYALRLEIKIQCTSTQFLIVVLAVLRNLQFQWKLGYRVRYCIKFHTFFSFFFFSYNHSPLLPSQIWKYVPDVGTYYTYVYTRARYLPSSV